MRRLLLLALLPGASAAAQGFNDTLVQPPALAPPSRGSIAGSLAGFAANADELARGSFTLHAPLELPSARGGLLTNVVPSYAPDAGLSEWGMGWRTSLAITRHRTSGDLDYTTDGFVSPWGELVAGSDGYFYPQAFATRIRLGRTAAGNWLAIDGAGTRYEFDWTVTNPLGTYAWYLTRVESIQGDALAIAYASNASGRAFVDSITYGGRGHITAYRVVLGYTLLAHPFDDYRSGARLTLDRQVTSIAVEVEDNAAYRPRWSYTLGYQTSPFSRVFYLREVQRSFASGATEPATVYQYDHGDATLAAAQLEHVTGLDSVIRQYGTAGIQPSAVAQLDVEGDGLLDLEHHVAQETIRQRPTGWTVEATPASPTPDPRCRRAPSTLNPPRILARMRASDAGERVLHASYSSGPNQTTLVFCDRPGAVLDTQTVSGRWTLGATTRLVDLDRDHQPELVRHSAGQVAVLANTSNATDYQFAADAVQNVLPAYTPSGSWIYDVNGDGMPDLASRYDGGLTVWYGAGRRRFVSTGADLRLYDRNGVRVQGLGGYGVWFVDANNDGRADVVLSRTTRAWLFMNRGDELREVVVPALASASFTQSNPIFGDVRGNGNQQIALARIGAGGLAEVDALDLDTPATGLLVSADDGKGTRIAFEYTRAAPAPGSRHRPSLLAATVATSAGLDPVRRTYEYRAPHTHRTAETLVGFADVRTLGPFVTEARGFALDDDIPPMRSMMTTSDTRTAGLVRVEATITELRTHLGVRWLRPVRTESRWVRPSDDRRVGRTVEFLAYERELCPVQTRSDGGDGTLTETTTLAAPSSLVAALHCLPAVRTLAGQHTDASLNFTESLTIARTPDGQITEVARTGAAGKLVLQTIGYDIADRIDEISRPGRGATTVEYDAATGFIAALVAPDGVRTSALRDPVHEGVTALTFDRGLGITQTTSFRYDGFERLARTWDSVKGGSDASPLQAFAYKFAGAGEPGAISVDSVVDPTTGAGTETLALFTGDGQPFATFTGIPEGFAAGSMTTHSDVTLSSQTLRRALLTGQRPETASFATLLAGARVVGATVRAGFGHASATAETIQSGVTRQTVTALTLDPDALVTATTENGALVTRRATRLGGSVVWVEDQEGNRTRIVHDALGRIRRVTLPDQTAHAVDYDAYGRTSRITHSGAGELRYEYQADTGLLARTRVGTGTGDVRTTQYFYDAIGRAVEHRHTRTADGASSSFFFTYDGGLGTPVPGQLGFLTQVDGPDYHRSDRFLADGSLGSRTVEVLGWRAVSWTHTYYADGSPRRSVRSVVDLTTDAVLEEVTEDHGVDGFGRRAHLDIDGVRVADAGYDSLGRLGTAILTGGTTLTYSFDPETDRRNGYASTGPHASASSWSLDERGKIEREITGAGGVTWDRSFTYDPRGFLVDSTDATGVSESWTFGASGMPASISDLHGARTLARSGAVLTAGSRQYGYDGIGRVTSLDGVTYKYGPDGQLARASSSLGPIVGYVYDEAGNRVGKTRAGAPEVVFVGGGYLDAGGFVEPVRLGGRIVGIIEAGVFRALETDGRGSVLASENGAACAVSPFGARAVRPDIAAALDYVENGYDADLRTIRMGVRDYDPFIAQFRTPDPLFLGDIDACAGSPVDCNLYGYVRNDPLSWVDPSGRNPVAGWLRRDSMADTPSVPIRDVIVDHVKSEVDHVKSKIAGLLAKIPVPFGPATLKTDGTEVTVESVRVGNTTINLNEPGDHVGMEAGPLGFNVNRSLDGSGDIGLTAGHSQSVGPVKAGVEVGAQLVINGETTQNHNVGELRFFEKFSISAWAVELYEKVFEQSGGPVRLPGGLSETLDRAQQQREQAGQVQEGGTWWNQCASGQCR